MESMRLHALSALRIMSGLLVLQHGTTKYLSFPVSRMSDTQLMSMSGAAGLIELVCGGLVVIGLFTRPAAFICSGTMAVAYFMVHAPQSFFPVLNGGDAALLYCFVFFYQVFAGPGPWSLDAIMRKRG